MKQTKRWLLAEADQRLANRLAEQLGLAPVIARLLVRRGIADADAARRFLAPDRSGFYDPFLMKDMEKAVSRIRQAIATGQRIMVYGDYDADGATSTSLMYLTLKKLGAHVEFYIPDRFAEGYGLNGPALVQAKERGFELVVTVDNGIAAIEEARIARELGLDLIVTDHHTPPEVLPQAYAILNPKQPGCRYPDKMLAGVGIAFKVAQALLGELPEEFLDLAAVGTIADLAPLLDENRLLARYGLERINQCPRLGLKALIEVSGLQGKEITAGHVGFAIGPRINAAGRLDSATYAVELLITEDAERARELARFLHERNQERQELSARMFEEAVQEIEAHPAWLEDRVLVIAKEGWNPGVIGIVASRLVERYYRPTLMISLDDGMGKGSARSIDGFDLYDALHRCWDLFVHFGGHKMAAGFSIAEPNIGELRARLNRIAQEVLAPDDLIPKLDIDAELDLQAIDLEFVETVGRLAPFGFGNPIPRFQLNGVDLERCRAVGQSGEHLQLQVAKGGARLAGIAFRRGEDVERVSQWRRLDLVGELTVNEWNGLRSLQLVLDDWRPNPVQVLDCRQVPDKTRWLAEQAGEKDLLVVCFQPEAVAEAIRALEPYPWQEPHAHRVYTADAQGRLSEVWSTGRQKADLLSGDVVLYDLPVSLQQYQAVLAKTADTCRLHLLHGKADKQRVEQQLPCLLPDRKFFAGIYKLLEDAEAATGDQIRRRLKPQYHEAAELVLAVFVELGFAVRHGNTYHVNKGSNKRSLEESQLYRERLARIDAYRQVIAELVDSPGEQAVSQVLRWMAAKSEGVQGR